MLETLYFLLRDLEQLLKFSDEPRSRLVLQEVFLKLLHTIGNVAFPFLNFVLKTLFLGIDRVSLIVKVTIDLKEFFVNLFLDEIPEVIDVFLI